MGTARRRSKKRSINLADALFTRTQQRVLGLLFGQPDRDYGVVELIELADAGRGAVQRELERLTASGLVSVTTSGRLKRYRAEREAPIFHELSAIIDKTSGVPEALRVALASLADRVVVAVLYGSIAKGEDRAGSDIDVLIVSDDLALEEVYRALEPAERRLGRRVSPTLYTVDEFERRRREDHFVSRVLGGKHVVLLGTLDGQPTG